MPASMWRRGRRSEEVLAGIWAEVLRVERVGVSDNFFELGGDSILSIQVVSRARRAGLELSPRQVFEYQTIAELASVVGHQAERPRAAQGRVEGAVRLTPIQAWFFEQAYPAPCALQPGEVVRGGGDGGRRHAGDGAAGGAGVPRCLAAAVSPDGCRAGQQWHAPAAGIALEREDLSALPAEEQDARRRRKSRPAGSRAWIWSTGPSGGRCCSIAGAGGRRLLVILHHLVVDGVSWRIVRDDVERACAQLERGERRSTSGGKSTSYQQWAESLARVCGERPAGGEAAYWLGQRRDGVGAVPVDGPGGPTGVGTRRVTVRLDGGRDPRAAAGRASRLPDADSRGAAVRPRGGDRGVDAQSAGAGGAGGAWARRGDRSRRGSDADGRVVHEHVSGGAGGGAGGPASASGSSR